MKSLSEEFKVTPGQVELLNKAESLARKGLYHDAYSIYANLIAADRACAPAYLNMGVLNNILGSSVRETNAYFDMALQLAPNNPLVHFFRGMNLLMGGDFQEGWEEYRWRMKRPNPKTLMHKFPGNLWKGESLEGRTVSLWTEQGIGDEILALSMLGSLLDRKPAAVGVWVSRNLIPLVQRSFPSVRVNAREDIRDGIDEIQDCDLQVSVSELGQYLRSTPDAFPEQAEYLVPDPDMVKVFRKTYKKEKPVVGISWCSPGSPHAADKNISLMEFTDTIIRNTNQMFDFVSLQYGDVHKDIVKAEKCFHVKILEEGSFDPKQDIDLFAAQVAACDLIISTSNTTVHIAGAMGKPVWTFVPNRNVHLWYWFRNKAHSLYYPSMVLKRGNIYDVMMDTKYELVNCYQRKSFGDM